VYIKVGHWQVQEESKMTFIITKIIRYLLTALATSHHTDKLSFTMLLYFRHNISIDTALLSNGYSWQNVRLRIPSKGKG
jgi:hypothetical protein